MGRLATGVVDFRPEAERDRQRTQQAMAGLLDTIGRAEKARRDSQTLDRVARAISTGATTVEAISAAANQGPEFSSGFQGILQKISGGFSEPGGSARESIIQSIIGQKLSKSRDPLETDLMKARIDEMGRERVGAMPYAVTQMTPEQKERWLDEYGKSVTVQTGEKLLKPEQRQERAETEFIEKVGMSSTERSNALKSIEGIFESTPQGAGRWGGWKIGIQDYERETVIGMYKQWLTEQGYEPMTSRRKERLDEIWDGKMTLMNKAGYKFKDKDRGRLGKKEIWWDPDDPEIVNLRSANSGGNSVNSGTRRLEPGLAPPETSPGEMPGATEPENERTVEIRAALAPIFEKAKNNGISRGDLYKEMAKLKDLGLTEEEYLTAYDKLADGATAEQIIEFLKTQ